MPCSRRPSPTCRRWPRAAARSSSSPTPARSAPVAKSRSISPSPRCTPSSTRCSTRCPCNSSPTTPRCSWARTWTSPATLPSRSRWSRALGPGPPDLHRRGELAKPRVREVLRVRRDVKRGKTSMIGDWRRLALAALAAAGVAVACATHGQAQAPPKAAAKKAPPENAEGESGDPDAAKKPAKKKQDPAEAQRAIEAAAKLLEIGKADQAAQSLTAVVVGGNLPPAIRARALLYRGIAYRQQKKPAQAIADLTSALWLKG